MALNIKKKFLRESAVYWPPLQAGPNGVMVFDNPVQLAVRWEHRNELQMEPNGDKWMSKAIVLVEMAIQIQGVLLYCGPRFGPTGVIDYMPTKVDQSDILNPYLNDGASEIHRYDRIPDLKATAKGTLHRVTL